MHHIPRDITFFSFLLLPSRLASALAHLGAGVGGVDGGVGARPRLRRGGQPSLSGMLLETYCSDAATLSTVNTQNTTQLDRAQHPDPRQSTTITEERKEHQHCFIE